MIRSKLLVFVSLIAPLAMSSSVIAQDSIDLSDVGQVWLENSGAAAAQQAFHHGLAQLHNFEYDLAATDFREAQRLDPDFALAYWGEAMTHNHPIWMEQDKSAAVSILNKYASSPAARQDRAGTELERDLLAAVDVLYGAGSKQAQDDLYSEKMAELYAKYPRNAEVASFYALSLMGTTHEGREFAPYMQAAAVVQNLADDFPSHPGVAHYMIHATDDPIHAPLGLSAANAYGGIAPNAGHAQHMTTHIFLALGDWEGVIRANVRATEIANAQRAARGQGPSNCGHYPSWLMYGHLQLGQRDAAEQIMNFCYEEASQSNNPNLQSAFVWQRALYLFDTQEWDGSIAALQIEQGERLWPTLQDLVVNGWIQLHKGNPGAAEAQLNNASKVLVEMKRLSDAGKFEGPMSTLQEAEVILLQLDGLIAVAKGDNDKGLAMMREAVKLELELPFGFGPPQPAKPSLELLGETLVSLGHLDEAREVLKTSLSRTPNKALTLAALRKTE